MLLENSLKINPEDFRNLDKEEAIKTLFDFFDSNINKETIGRYTYIDEIDVMEFIYLFLKYSKGQQTLKRKLLKSTGMKLSMNRLRNNPNEFTDDYSLYNGDLTDLLLHFYMDNFFSHFDDVLLEKYGFSKQVFNVIYLFISNNKNGIFNINNLEIFVKESISEEHFDQIIQEVIAYIEYFTIDEKDLNLSTFSDFRKDIRKKPFIKLPNNDILFHYYFYRTEVFSNFHYLLNDDEEYKKFKGEHFENIVADVLEHALGSDAEVYQNIQYHEGEMDILVETANHLILVECKSNILYDDYKYSKLNKATQSNLQNIIDKAESQLLRDLYYTQSNKDLYCNSQKITIDTTKNIILLNVCLDFPIGYANKKTKNNVISLSLADLIFIVDELEDPLVSDNPRTKNLCNYLIYRQKLLGCSTDNELTILINILYNPHLETIIENKHRITINSDQSITNFNRLHHLLLLCLYNPQSYDAKKIKNYYKGYLEFYIFEQIITI